MAPRPIRRSRLPVRISAPAPPASTPETCQSGDTGDDFGWGGLVFQDLSHGWGGGEAGNCIGLLLTSWSNTQVVFTFGNQYANYGPMNPGDQVEATIQGATDTVTASFPNLPSISSVTLTGTAANPTVTVSGSNFGSNPPTGTPETCQSGDTGDDYGSAGLILQDTTESWGAGQSGDCIGLLLTSWSNTQVVFTVGNEYAHYGPIAVGDQIKVTVQGATDTVTASFSTPVVPTVTAVSPNSGSTAGGTAITITGTGFIAGAKVTVGQGSGAVTGAISATSVTVVSSTKITAVTGGGAKAGTWSLFVTTSGGTSAANTSDNFTYNAASVVPTVTTVSPNSGSTAGGTAITITGTGFIAGAKVTVGQGSGAVTGAISATSVTVVSSTKITAVTGGGAKAGTWSLFVTTSGGTSAANTSDNFTYNTAAAVPTVTGVSPNSGPTSGGTAITITGTGFIAGAKVTVGQGSGAVTGAISATSVTVVSSTKITAVTGGGAKAGTWSLFVTTSGGTSAANTSDNFTY